jgi:hypothetical protein
MSGPSTTKGTAEAVRDAVFMKPLRIGSKGRAEIVLPAGLGTQSACTGFGERGSPFVGRIYRLTTSQSTLGTLEPAHQ